MNKPFDDLPTVTELIRLYKAGGRLENLAKHFKTSLYNVRYTLVTHNTKIRGRGEFKPRSVKTEIPKGTGKYDALFEEPVNNGLDYEQYIKKAGIKKPKEYQGWGRMHNYKRKTP